MTEYYYLEWVLKPVYLLVVIAQWRQTTLAVKGADQVALNLYRTVIGPTGFLSAADFIRMLTLWIHLVKKVSSV